MYANRTFGAPHPNTGTQFQAPVACDPATCCCCCQQQQQPGGMCAAFCSNGATGGCCQQDPTMGMDQCCGPYFDFGLVWMVLKIVGNWTGVILVLTVLNRQTIFAAFDLAEDQAQTNILQEKVLPQVLPLPQAVRPTSAAPTNLPDLPCVMQPMAGSGGSLCASLNAAEFVINLSRWNNFRSVLFVLNGVFSLLVFFVMIRVKMARENMEPLVWKQSALKTVVDAIQFCIGVLVLVWVGLEMYYFWGVMGLYTQYTRNDLQKFWRNYQWNWYFSILLVLLSLSFGVVLWAVKLVVFIVGYVPAKMCMTMQGSMQPMGPAAGTMSVRVGGTPLDGGLDQTPCMTSTSEFFDNFLMVMLSFGFRGALWDYVVKGQIPEDTNPAPRPTSRLDWMNQPPDLPVQQSSKMPGLDGDMENPEDGHSPVKPYDDEDLIESRGKAPPLPPSYPPSMAHRASQMQMHNHMMQPHHHHHHHHHHHMMHAQMHTHAGPQPQEMGQMARPQSFADGSTKRSKGKGHEDSDGSEEDSRHKKKKSSSKKSSSKKHKSKKSKSSKSLKSGDEGEPEKRKKKKKHHDGEEGEDGEGKEKRKKKKHSSSEKKHRRKSSAVPQA